METGEKVVLHSKRGSVYWITINRPERRNAVTDEVMAEIREGIRLANEDPAIRVIVLTGKGDGTIPDEFEADDIVGIDLN